LDYSLRRKQADIPRASSDFIALTLMHAGTGGPSKYFGSESPVGRRFGLGRPDKAGEVEIIGVVRDAKDIDLRTETPSLVSLPSMQVPV
jgi:hypothetical protein